jgi:iron-chelate-transporting ATPase
MNDVLAGHDLVLGYPRSTVVHGVSVSLRPGVVTALIGPNGSGKSTVLRSLARLHPVDSGRVSLGGDDCSELTSRHFARQVTMLSQSRPHPSGLTVHDVVAFGRHPHRRRFAALTEADRASIARALDLTGTTDMDLRYQVETLDLVRELADDHGTAIGVVLHDLDQAATVADHVVLLHDGRVRAAGRPVEVLTADHLSEVYGLPIDVTRDPATGRVRIEPRRRHLVRT